MPRVTITVPSGTPQPYRFPLDRRKVSLGRSSESDIPIDCQSVSGKHAEMVRVEGGYELRDMNSTNGSKLNGERRMVIALTNGSSVELGDVAFDFELNEDELSTLRGEAYAANAVPVEAPRAESLAAAPASSGRSGGMMLLLFLVLAAGAFAIGMDFKHRKDTGHSLWQDLGKKKAPKTAAAPAADSTPTADAAPVTEPAPATTPEAPAPAAPAADSTAPAK